ncbi:uncharacterized protein LOC130986300 [Salvia miltiorrhiza]|uniref:uncharacterized protein LOC130986300 n=1 Tax=Salvia miltiorrhiza TaxID=226208 RepID=UPI0025ABC91C|nr:uncharacterized protein LOC130986300 [Salvia miltiorrhiza]
MREKGKAIEAFSNDIPEFNYSAASELPCRKHPNSSSVGICAHCLKDRLVKLVCSECGEQRLSSCSCSDVSSSYRNSCSTMEVGSVGRVSFLIENDKTDQVPKARREERSEQVIFLRRSTSSCVEVKKTNGFWRIKRLFRKRRSKGCGEFSDEVWVSDAMGVSRSRSLCSFRGGADEGMSDCALSSAKISDVTSGIFLDSDKQFGFLNDSEPRRSGFRGIDQFDRAYSVPNRSVHVFPAKESDFSAMDESAFIDLKLDLSAESIESVGGFANMTSSGDSCRITMNDRGLKRGGRTHKVWKWIFKYPPTNKNKGK